jgi:hypothetical protein
MKTRTFLTISSLAIILAVSAAPPAHSAEPIKQTISSTNIKDVGDPVCDAGTFIQTKALIATVVDSRGSREVEFYRWSQSTGKACTGAKTVAKLEISEKILAEAKSRGVTGEVEVEGVPKQRQMGGCNCYHNDFYDPNVDRCVRQWFYCNGVACRWQFIPCN